MDSKVARDLLRQAIRDNRTSMMHNECLEKEAFYSILKVVFVRDVEVGPYPRDRRLKIDRDLCDETLDWKVVKGADYVYVGQVLKTCNKWTTPQGWGIRFTLDGLEEGYFDEGQLI